MNQSVHNPDRSSIDSRTETLIQVLSGELFRALGFSSSDLMARIFSPLVRKAVYRFVKIVMGFDEQVALYGFQEASNWILPNFISSMQANGIEYIPKEGPLLITSNHPGVYDALVVTANIPRDDIKIIASIPQGFINQLPAIKPHFFHVTLDPEIRYQVTRSAIKHLQIGGSILIFASGGIDPDPASMPGVEEEIKTWSRSLEIFLRRVPDTQVLISMISGILSPIYIHHPFTFFRKGRRDKQRISEFFQVIHQMLKPGQFLQTPRVSFRNAILPRKADTNIYPKELMDSISNQALQLLQDHLISDPSHS